MLVYPVIVQVAICVEEFSTHSAEQLEAGHSIKIIATLSMPKNDPNIREYVVNTAARLTQRRRRMMVLYVMEVVLG